MTGLHCDRCGSALPEPAARTAQGRLLCPACAAALPEPRRTSKAGVVLASLAAALFAGWTAYRFVVLRADLSALERRLSGRPAAPPPPAGLSPAQAELLERLAAHPPAAASDLEALRGELEEAEALLRRPGGLAALAPFPPPSPPVIPLLPPFSTLSTAGNPARRSSAGRTG